MWQRYTMFLLSTFLVFAIVEGSPTTTKSATTHSATHAKKADVILSNGTHLAHKNDSSHVGLRDSLEKDISYIRSKYQIVRQGFDDWMEAPYHRNVVIPVLMGIISAGTALICYCLLKNLSKRCMKRFARTRISYMSRDFEDEKKHMIPKRGGESDDDI